MADEYIRKGRPRDLNTYPTTTLRFTKSSSVTHLNPIALHTGYQIICRYGMSPCGEDRAAAVGHYVHVGVVVLRRGKVKRHR